MTTKTDSTGKHNGLFMVCLVVAALYFARDVLIPLALAILFAFLLHPVANFLERIKFGRVASALIAVLVAISIASALSYCIVGQLANFGKELPKYEKTIHEKIQAIESKGGGLIGHATRSIQDFRKDLSPTNVPASTVTNTAAGAPAKAPEVKAVPVEVRDPDSSALKFIQKVIGPSVNFAVTLFLVTVFCIFILVGRDDLRHRLISIVGSRNTKMTNQLLNDTSGRVGRYLLMQLVVNVTYGVPIGLGLWAIGVPNPLLWGMLSSIFRYIPYAGPWIAACLPLAISFAISTEWSKPLLVLVLYGVVEILTANLFEPVLYGNSTGITPLAVLLSAVFWTWVWGPIGLLLSMPLTVCLVSIARYVPQLELLDQLFGETKGEAAH